MELFLQALVSEYAIHLYVLISIYVILSHGFNFTFGLGNLFNLAHVGAYAIGAYTAALLSVDRHLDFWSAFFVGVLFSGLSSSILALISLRLKEDYFAVGSLAFASVVSALLMNWKSLTRGVLGIPGIPRPVVFGTELVDNSDFLILSFSICFVASLLAWIFIKSPFARSLRAVAEFERGAEALGRNARLLRTVSFVLGSAYAGSAGVLFAYYLNYIDPSSFSLAEMIFVVSIVVLGHPGSFWGIIGAAVFLVLLPESLRFIEISSSYLGPARQLLYSLILFIVVFINRDKLFPRRREV